MRISDWSSDVCSSDLLAVRLDTHGGRYVEGLDPQASYAVLERHVPNAIRQYRTEAELRWLVGTGVSAAALFHMRTTLDRAGFFNVKIVASSGFNAAKCKVMASVQAPIDIVGTGSRSEEHTSELQSLMCISYAVFCLKKKTQNKKLQP